MSMFDSDQLKVLRRAYARSVLFIGGVNNPELEHAFANVRRERFLENGPWSIFRWPRGYSITPDDDPAWLYNDVLVGIRPERGLNNGQPSSHAAWIAAVSPRSGEHLVHVGAGVGYYTAILAEMVGRAGRVTAIEYDTDLAASATRNLADLDQVTVIAGDGSTTFFEPADVIYVNAGTAYPASSWLDGLKPGGRLLLPLTTIVDLTAPRQSHLTGAVFLIERTGDEYDASFVSPIAVFPCEGMRDEGSERALAESFKRPGMQKVRKLRRTDRVPEGDCWLKAPGWALTYS